MLLTELTHIKVEDECLADATVNNYKAIVSFLRKYLGKEDVTTDDLAALKIKPLLAYMQEKGLANTTIKNYIKKINGFIYYYNELTESEIKTLHIPRRKKYQCHTKKKSLSRSDIDAIFNYLNSHPEFHSYYRRNSLYFSLQAWGFGFIFGGLALVDLAKIKKSQVKVLNINNIEYYSIENVYRSKTDTYVPIVIKKEGIAEVIIEVYMNNTPSDYLFPIIVKSTTSVFNAVRKASEEINSNLRECIKMINAEMGTTIDEELTFYSNRHSFASSYVNCGGDLSSLAVLMGRSVNGIATYVKSIQTADDIIGMRSKLEGVVSF